MAGFVSSFGHSSFELDSSFEFRHSSFGPPVGLNEKEVGVRGSEGKPMLTPSDKRQVEVNGDPDACSWTGNWVSRGFRGITGAFKRERVMGEGSHNKDRTRREGLGGVLEAPTRGRAETSPESDGDQWGMSRDKFRQDGAQWCAVKTFVSAGRVSTRVKGVFLAVAPTSELEAATMGRYTQSAGYRTPHFPPFSASSNFRRCR
jgi:hypothetical protein